MNESNHKRGVKGKKQISNLNMLKIFQRGGGKEREGNMYVLIEVRFLLGTT